MKHTHLPLISVILPVHNNEQYVGSAIQSILDQTYKNFELLILSSTTTNEKSLEVIQSFSDPRIQHIRLLNNENLPQSLNRGIKESQGEYVARMDADDISLSHRLEREVQYMLDNPDITILGSWAKTFGAKNTYIKHPTEPAEIKANLLFQTSLVHPTVMMKKKEMQENRLEYNPAYACSEDIDLWARSAEKVCIANIPQILLLYRTHHMQATHVRREEIAKIRTEVRVRQFSHLGITPTPHELALHSMITEFRSENGDNFLPEAGEWLLKISKANVGKELYNQEVLDTVLAEKWFEVCYIAKSWKRFWSNALSSSFKKTPRNIFRLSRLLFRSL